MSSESVWGGIRIIGWVFPALLLLLVVVTMRAGHGKIPPNSLVGIRLPSVRRSAAPSEQLNLDLDRSWWASFPFSFGRRDDPLRVWRHRSGCIHINCTAVDQADHCF